MTIIVSKVVTKSTWHDCTYFLDASLIKFLTLSWIFFGVRLCFVFDMKDLHSTKETVTPLAIFSLKYFFTWSVSSCEKGHRHWGVHIPLEVSDESPCLLGVSCCSCFIVEYALAA